MSRYSRPFSVGVKPPLTATSLQRPLFWLTVHTFTLVSASLQRPLCSVLKVAVVDRFNCKILRSVNAKYQFYLFLYKINKGDLPLMYSCVLWCEFIYFVVFLAVNV